MPPTLYPRHLLFQKFSISSFVVIIAAIKRRDALYANYAMSFARQKNTAVHSRYTGFTCGAALWLLTFQV